MGRKAVDESAGQKEGIRSGGHKPPKEKDTSKRPPEEFYHLSKLMQAYGGAQHDWLRLIDAGELKAKKGPRSGDYLITRDSWRRFIGETVVSRSTWLGRAKPRPQTKKPTNKPKPEGTMPTAIEVIPGVCGGDPVVAGTRIPVWELEQMRRMGATAEKILDEYPTLRLQDIQNAWAYAAAHPDEIDRQIHENEVA